MDPRTGRHHEGRPGAAASHSSLAGTDAATDRAEPGDPAAGLLVGPDDESDTRGPSRTALVSIAAATFLVVLKLGTGLVSGSLGLISAGIESSGDVVAAVLTLLALRMGARPADVTHPYGHRRAENLAALGEAAILTGGGFIILVEAVSRLLGGGETLQPAWFVYAVIGTALVVDVSRVVVSARTARKYGSAALRSNAFHFAGDMAGSLAVLAGFLLIDAGFEQGDTVAAIVVACVIFAAATRLVYENAGVLMDRAPADAHDRAQEAIDALGSDIELRRLRLRESAGRYFADAVIAVPPGRAVVEGHATADNVEQAVREALPGSDVVVHIEPRRRGLDLRDRVLAAALSEPLVREAHDITIYEHGGRCSVSLHLKLPDDVGLDAAHDAAERVEAAVRRERGVVAVQTHLEPLEHPVAVMPTGARSDEELERTIRRLVQRRTRRAPTEVRLLHTDAGLVVFLSLGLDAGVSLTDAHKLASELEEDLRAQYPFIADVVVHTEPAEAGPGGPRRQ
jgi:cation diffusion facilitator family transporter